MGINRGRGTARHGLLAAVLLGLALLPGVARATVVVTGCGSDNTCTLTELLGGGTITVDGIVFDDWEKAPPGNYANSLVVTGLEDGGTDPGPGLRFTFSPAFSQLTAYFLFDVTLPDGFVLDGVSMAWQATGNRPKAALDLTTPVLLDDIVSLDRNHASGSASFDPATTARFAIQPSNSSSSISQIDVRFMLTPLAVPAPAGTALLALALAGLAVGRRRRI